MSDYHEILKAMIAGDIAALDDIAQRVAGFPAGRDAFVGRHWITNAVDCGTTSVVSWMLEKGVLLDFCDEEGYTVLHSALDRNPPERYDLMRMLIAAGADLNLRGINDWTPAHLAAVRNDVEALRILKEAGADFGARTGFDDYATPQEEAEYLGGSDEAVAYLRSVTARPG